VLALLFYVALLPIGLVMRLLGKTQFSLQRKPTVETYWIRREIPGPPPDTMRHQF